MDRVMKISANQSGSLSATKNLVDFDISEGLTYDLSKSYLVINSSIDNTDAHATAQTLNDAGGGTGVAAYPQFSGGAGVYNSYVGLFDGTNTASHFKNKHLVKNVSMYSQKVGMVEDIRNSNVLQYNLDMFRDDVDTKVNGSYNQVSSIFGANAVNGIRASPYRRFSPLGTEASDDLNREIRVGLSEVMNSCNNIWDGTKYGNTRVHAELSLGALRVEESLGAGDGIWAASDGDRQQSQGAVARNKILRNTVGGELTTLTTFRKYTNPKEDSGFYVGQKITASGSITGGANITGFVRQIIEIEHVVTGANEGRLILTFDSAWQNGTIPNDATITIKGCDSATKTINLDSAELVLYVTDKVAPDQIAFTTYKTEEDSTSGATYNHQYYLESDVQNIFWGSRTVGQLGFRQTINTYRIREGGQDKTDRDVTHGSSLHLSRLSRSFANSNMRIKNLSAAIMNNGVRVVKLLSNAGQTMDLPVFMIGETCEVTEMPKLLDVNIVGSAGGFSLITLFKQMVKIM